MKPTNSASSFSKREKIRRKTCCRRDRRLISLRRSYTSRSYFRGSHRVLRGGTTGVKPRAVGVSRRSRRRGPSPARGWRVATKAVEELAVLPARRACLGESENVQAVPTSATTIQAWWSAAAGLASTEDRFFQRPRPVGMDLDDGAVEQHRLQSEAHDPLPLQPVEDPVEHLVLEPAIHARVCPAEPGRHSISFRRSYTFRSYFRGSRRVLRGGTTGVKPRAVGVSRRPRRRGPSPARGWRVATKAMEEFESFRRVAPVWGRARTSRPSGHPRQPYQAWWSSRCGTCLDRGPFFPASPSRRDGPRRRCCRTTP